MDAKFHNKKNQLLKTSPVKKYHQSTSFTPLLMVHFDFQFRAQLHDMTLDL